MMPRLNSLKVSLEKNSRSGRAKKNSISENQKPIPPANAQETTNTTPNLPFPENLPAVPDTVWPAINSSSVKTPPPPNHQQKKTTFPSQAKPAANTKPSSAPAAPNQPAKPPPGRRAKPVPNPTKKSTEEAQSTIQSTKANKKQYQQKQQPQPNPKSESPLKTHPSENPSPIATATPLKPETSTASTNIPQTPSYADITRSTSPTTGTTNNPTGSGSD